MNEDGSCVDAAKWSDSGICRVIRVSEKLNVRSERRDVVNDSKGFALRNWLVSVCLELEKTGLDQVGRGGISGVLF